MIKKIGNFENVVVGSLYLGNIFLKINVYGFFVNKNNKNVYC